MARFSKSFQVTKETLGMVVPEIERLMQYGAEPPIEVQIIAEIPGLARVRTRGTPAGKKRRKASVDPADIAAASLKATLT